MKKLIFTILLLLTTAIGYSQKYTPGVLIGKKYRQIEKIMYIQKDYRLINKNDSTLTYFNWVDDIYVEYHFIQYKKAMYCSISTITLDCLSGEELIGSHSIDWESINDSTWLYNTPAYDKKLLVKLSYVDGFMRFDYHYRY